MYENIIVPFDGSLSARAVLAPAADLAWRNDARLVVVNDSDTTNQALQGALKSRAMSMSGADVDFWVDLEHDLGNALVQAAQHRPDPLIMVPVRTRPGGLRRRPVLGAVPTAVLTHSPVPVVVIGPCTDVSRGMPLTELVVALDGSPESESVLPVAADWARYLRVSMVLVGVVREGAAGAGRAESDYLSAKAQELRDGIAEVSCQLVEASDPASGLIDLLQQHDNAVIAMSTHGRSGLDRHPLGSVAQGVLLGSPRAMLFVRPSS